MKPGFKPMCFGQFKEQNPACQQCKKDNDSIFYECHKELVLSILEGRSVRPSVIIEWKETKR